MEIKKPYGVFGFKDPDNFSKLAVSYHDPSPSSLGIEFTKVLYAITYLSNGSGLGHLRMSAVGMRLRQDDEPNNTTKNNRELMRFLLCPPPISDNVCFKDGNNAIRDGMWCEWAYVYNFSGNCLEVHRGGNKNPDAIGDYVTVKKSDSEYCGPRLVAKISLDKLIKGDVNEFEKIFLKVTYDTVKGKDLLGLGTQKKKAYKGAEILTF